MATHTISAGKRSPVRFIAILVALAIAVAGVAIQARAIWSTDANPIAPPPSVRIQQDPAEDGYAGPKHDGGLADRPSLKEVLQKKQ